LNRLWDSPRRSVAPTIAALKSLMAEVSGVTELSLFCDFHGHSRKENAFIYGCHCDGDPERAHLPRVFPHLLAAQCAPFSYDDCSFKMQESKRSSARMVGRQQLGIFNSFTLEASFAGTTIVGAPYHFTQTDFRRLGADFVAALHAYTFLPPIEQAGTIAAIAEHERLRAESGRAGDGDSSEDGSDEDPADGDLEAAELEAIWRGLAAARLARRRRRERSRVTKAEREGGRRGEKGGRKSRRRGIAAVAASSTREMQGGGGGRERNGSCWPHAHGNGAGGGDNGGGHGGSYGAGGAVSNGRAGSAGASGSVGMAHEDWNGGRSTRLPPRPPRKERAGFGSSEHNGRAPITPPPQPERPGSTGSAPAPAPAPQAPEAASATSSVAAAAGREWQQRGALATWVKPGVKCAKAAGSSRGGRGKGGKGGKGGRGSRRSPKARHEGSASEGTALAAAGGGDALLYMAGERSMRGATEELRDTLERKAAEYRCSRQPRHSDDGGTRRVEPQSAPQAGSPRESSSTASANALQRTPSGDQRVPNRYSGFAPATRPGGVSADQSADWAPASSRRGTDDTSGQHPTHEPDGGGMPLSSSPVPLSPRVLRSPPPTLGGDTAHLEPQRGWWREPSSRWPTPSRAVQGGDAAPKARRQQSMHAAASVADSSPEAAVEACEHAAAMSNVRHQLEKNASQMDAALLRMERAIAEEGSPPRANSMPTLPSRSSAAASSAGAGASAHDPRANLAEANGFRPASGFVVSSAQFHGDRVLPRVPATLDRPHDGAPGRSARPLPPSPSQPQRVPFADRDDASLRAPQAAGAWSEIAEPHGSPPGQRHWEPSRHGRDLAALLARCGSEQGSPAVRSTSAPQKLGDSAIVAVAGGHDARCSTRTASGGSEGNGGVGKTGSSPASKRPNAVGMQPATRSLGSTRQLHRIASKTLGGCGEGASRLAASSTPPLRSGSRQHSAESHSALVAPESRVSEAVALAAAARQACLCCGLGSEASAASFQPGGRRVTRGKAVSSTSAAAGRAAGAVHQQPQRPRAAAATMLGEVAARQLCSTSVGAPRARRVEVAVTRER